MTENNKIKIYDDGGSAILKVPGVLVESLQKGDSGGLYIHLPGECHDCSLRNQVPVPVKKELPTGYIDQFSRACKALIATTCGRNRFCRALLGLISFSTLFAIIMIFLWVVLIKK